LWQTSGLEKGRSGAHIGGMRWHAISIIAAGTMITVSVFFALRPHHDDKGIRPPIAGLIGSQCAIAPENGLIPVEQTCETP
jgi:hypothetical protein